MAGEINLSGLDNLSLSGNDYGTTSSGGGFLSDMWGNVKGFLQEGIDIAGDFAGVKAAWDSATNDSGAYTQQYQPTDETSLANMNSEAKATMASSSGQWVNGVPNGVLMLGGAAVVLGLLAMKGGR